MPKVTNDFMGDLQKLVDAGEIKPLDSGRTLIDRFRHNAYLRMGITLPEMIVALWEYIVEGRPEALDTLQIKRLKIKNKYPKPKKE
jgi:hypothetical protein